MENWFSHLHPPYKQLVDARVLRIQKYEHFGNIRIITSQIAELKWKNGIRVYFFKEDNEIIFLLLGGLKNAKKKDIKKAKLLFQKYANC
jgi:putative addiction module killer protein